MLNETDALLIADVQYDFLPGGALGVPGADAIVPVLSALAAKFEAATLPVIATRDWHPPDHCSFERQGGPWPTHCVAGTPGAALSPELRLPKDVKIIDKATTPDKEAYSAFQGTGLADWLRSKGVRHLYIGGLATEYCVLNTAADAIKIGLDVTVIEDGIGAIDDADGQRAIDSLKEMNVSITTSDKVLDD